MQNPAERKILILTNANDQSTSQVIEWLNYWRKPFIRINDVGSIMVKQIHLTNEGTDILFTINTHTISLSEVSAFWYRRGNFVYVLDLPERHRNYLSEEFESVFHFLITQLDDRAAVSYYHNRDINKGYQLQKAKKCGLNIPETIVSDTKHTLINFFNQKQFIISKSIQSTFMVKNQDKVDLLYTTAIHAKDIKRFSDKFFLTKFQEQISKQFELRIFYFDRKFYPMAIFSQRNSKTKTDFREYDYEKPNRGVPFILPLAIETKLQNLMDELLLLSGSIDMIVDEQEEYYFLEVNPIGQFGMVSIPCQYYLEKLIALKLTQPCL